MQLKACNGISWIENGFVSFETSFINQRNIINYIDIN